MNSTQLYTQLNVKIYEVFYMIYILSILFGLNVYAS